MIKEQELLLELEHIAKKHGVNRELLVVSILLHYKKEKEDLEAEVKDLKSTLERIGK